MAQGIVENLKVKLGSEGENGAHLVKRYTEDPEAHSLYLKGLFYINRYTPEDLANGRECLEAAVVKEPLHARAWVQLAEYYIHRGMGAVPPSAAMPQALDAAQRAVAADPSLGAAHAATAMVMAFYQHRWREALAQVQAAAHLPPSVWYYIWSGVVHWSNGKFEEAVRHIQRALELDPLSFIAHHLLALFYNQTDRKSVV